VEGVEEGVAGAEWEENDSWADIFAVECIIRAVNSG
jgi:hypothetical protein